MMIYQPYLSKYLPSHITTSHFNIISTGIFPDRLKIAKIIPLFKKEDPPKLDDYRPISLLPAFSKIFEKAAFIQSYTFFNKNNILYESHYGFRTLHSTELAYLEIIGNISKDLDNVKLPIWGISWFIKIFWYIGPHNSIT